ncbi:23S rRNA (uracil(1939)-C(5))-methyltransferase RlmD [Eubacteriales bacterium OttesenSCG-928-K08]|nr:23S rRNA (uracil(1939)-C(5))-methyltransferase RlmD [Eubacteriales bacterium OttesenSCG-928-K08]
MTKLRPVVKKNDEVTLQIQSIGAQGQGVGRVEGYAVFVPGALNGETVRAHIIKVGSSFGVGKLLEVLEPSEFRVLPDCGLNGKCGGCTLQHLDYSAQLAYKRQVVEDAFTRLGGLKEVNIPPVLGMEHPYQYRNKASFPFANVNGRVEIGFFAPHSHRLVPVEDCLLQREDVLLAALAVRDWARDYNVLAYDEQSRSGLLRHVVARVGDKNELMVTVVATAGLPHRDALIDRLQERTGCLKSLYLNINKADTNVIQGGEYRLLFGQEHIMQTLCGLRFSVGPATFLQVNSSQTEVLYQTAFDMLAINGTERIADLYCGMGAITLPLAKKTKSVVGIEAVKEAVEDAKKNALDNGIDNASFVCGDCGQVLEELGAFDAMVIDPPRKGAEPELLKAATKRGVKKIAYISCNPATLARDCALLTELGYTLVKVQPVDMFPQTVHIECVALLEKH